MVPVRLDAHLRRSPSSTVDKIGCDRQARARAHQYDVERCAEMLGRFRSATGTAETRQAAPNRTPAIGEGGELGRQQAFGFVGMRKEGRHRGLPDLLHWDWRWDNLSGEVASRWAIRARRASSVGGSEICASAAVEFLERALADPQLSPAESCSRASAADRAALASRMESEFTETRIWKPSPGSEDPVRASPPREEKSAMPISYRAVGRSCAQFQPPALQQLQQIDLASDGAAADRGELPSIDRTRECLKTKSLVVADDLPQRTGPQRPPHQSGAAGRHVAARALVGGPQASRLPKPRPACRSPPKRPLFTHSQPRS